MPIKIPQRVVQTVVQDKGWKNKNEQQAKNTHQKIIFPAVAAKSLQSCPTLCDPRDSSPPDSPVPGILQARTLKWVAISFSNA